jgi:hypothetical protein
MAFSSEESSIPPHWSYQPAPISASNVPEHAQIQELPENFGGNLIEGIAAEIYVSVEVLLHNKRVYF